jgi:hypothetical protein
MLNLLTYRVLAWISVGLGAVIVALSIALWAQGVQLGRMENQRDKAQQQVAQAQTTIKGQVALLGQCDAATKALDVEGRKRQAEAEKAVAKARSEAGRYQQEAKRLRGLQRVPTPSGADCRQAVREIRNQSR